MNQNNTQMVDYMVHGNSTAADHQQAAEEDQHQFVNETSLIDDKLNFQDVMQFADFGPSRLSNLQQGQQPKNIINPEETTTGGIDDDPNVFFLKFPVLNDYHQEHDHEQHDDDLMIFGSSQDNRGRGDEEDDRQQNKSLINIDEVKTNNNKKKRGRSIKTSEEVESQRMTHIAVERNRRKQMNEHLRLLRSLMPASYVQRGDQASIIGGAIEFVRELEQLLQCLESQKRRRLYGDNCPPIPAPPPVPVPLVVVDQDHHQPPQASFFPMITPPPPPAPPFNNDLLHETISQEEIAESKSCIADIEVRLLGFDAMIKILSRRRTGQLVKTIAALEDLQINILHTNITTIDQTVLYSFTVKVGGETRLTAEDIANSVQQIFTFIHAYDNI